MGYQNETVNVGEQTFTCSECGTVFTRRVKMNALTGKNHFCSRKCSRAFYHRKERKGVEFAEHSGVCRHCGKPFTFRVESYKKECFWPRYCQEPECQAERKRCLDETTKWASARWHRQKRAEKVEYKRVCRNCGKEFVITAKPGASEKSLKKCCSAGCSEAYRKKRDFVYNRTTKKGLPHEDVESMSWTEFDAYVKRLAETPHEVECAVCHKKFWSIYPTAKYCSKECKHIGCHADVYLNPDGTRKEKPVFERECPVCHKVFTTNNNKKLYCSDACRKSMYKRGGVEVVSRDRPVYDKVCPECGKAFQTNMSKKRFCSDRCRKTFFHKKEASPKKTVVRTCKQCGKEFVTTRYSGPNAQRFCSRECRLATIYAKNLIAHRKPRVTIKCEICGKEFEIAQGANRKYCSKDCKREAEYRKRGYVPRDPVVKTCKNCGKQFTTRNNMQQYCGAECKAAYRAAHPELREYERKVFEPKACTICGKVFVPKSKTQVTCGDSECKRKLNLWRVAEKRHREWVDHQPGPRECSYCHQTFTPDRHHPHQKFCSKKCQASAQYESRRALNPSVPPEPRECRHCHKVFTPDYLHPKQKYCSPECQLSARRRKSEKIEKTCVVCGKTFMGYAYQKTCSKECSYKNRSFGGYRKTSYVPVETVTVKAVCKNCGKEFEYERRGRQVERRYCSDACSKQYWKKYCASLKADLMADPEYVARREAMKAASKQERLDRLAALREEKAKAKAELREKIAAMRAMEKEQRAAERERLRADFKASRELERLEKALAAEEARDKARAEREAAREAERARKKAERDAAKAEAKKKREEERNARIMANREKRRQVAEETKRQRRERWEKIRLNPEEAAQLAKTKAERRLAKRVADAAKARAATRVREYAEHLAYIEKCRAEGKEIRKSVCKECGQEFEYVVEDWEQRRHNKSAINAMLKSRKTRNEVREWVLNPPEFCTKGCRAHWKYEHGGHQKMQEYHRKAVEAGGYWHGHRFVIPKKKEEVVSRWAGSGNFYSSQAARAGYSVTTHVDNKYAGLEDYASDPSRSDQQDEARFDADEAAEAKSFLDD